MDNELMINYLKGKIDPIQRAAFEKRIQEDSDFKREFEDTRAIFMGLRAVHKINQSHVDVDLLTKYAENPSSLEQTQLIEVETHLKSCQLCGQDLECMRQTFQTKVELIPHKEQTFLSRFFESLFSPRFVVRPVYALFVLMLLMVPIIWNIGILSTRTSEIETYRITPVVREAQDFNLVKIDNNAKLIRLEFSVPTIPQALYDIELYNPQSEAVFVWKAIQPRKTFAFEIPVSYFDVGGIYTFKVMEIISGISNEREHIRFNILLQ